MPPARSTAGPLAVEAPIAAKPLNKRQPPSTFDPRKEFEIMDAETPRGKPYFGRDPTKVERVLRNSPGCPSMVVDFLAGRAPRSNVDVPSCVTRVINSLPRAWTIDHNKVSDRRGDDATQALFALTLQAATMVATVARESELRPPVKKLQADLAESWKKCGEFCDRISRMAKDSLDATERARLQVEHLTQANTLLKEQVKEALKPYDVSMKQAAADITLHKDEMDQALAEIKRLSEKVEASEAVEARAAKMAVKTSALDREREELSAHVSELEKLRAVLASKEAQEAQDEEENNFPFSDPSHAAEFAYYMAFADALRSAKKGGIEIGHLLETFRVYATERPLHQGFEIPILDLSTEHSIDLSWYSRFDRLIQPVAPGEESIEGARRARTGRL
ncbi:hypothetical protein OROMI_002461 [Orobanche minor]